MANLFETRRDFLKNAAVTVLSLPILIGCKSNTLAQAESDILKRLKQKALPTSGEWSGAIDAPANVAWKTALAAAEDPGERMVISGTVFMPDGKTPAPNTLIYFYHTNVHGIYGRAGQHKHGKYRGWMLTDERGLYEFSSIRPASYPNSTQSQHVHMTITTLDQKEDWIDSILFEGDRFLTSRERETAGSKGAFFPIVKLAKGADGVMTATRDIKLG